MAPKGGMIAMTVRAFLREPRRPVVFQPVYIGYEKLIEGKSYLDELTGQPKEKETIWALVRGVFEVLRSQLRQGDRELRRADPAGRAAGRARSGLARRSGRRRQADLVQRRRSTTWPQRIQVNINRAADVNPINLLALALLSTPKHAMAESDLLAQLALSQDAAGGAAVFAIASP